MFVQGYKEFFCSQAIRRFVVLSCFLTSWSYFASLSMSNLTNNKRNLRLPKFNGSYQALTEVSLVRSFQK